jgi:hypothetical protein
MLRLEFFAHTHPYFFPVKMRLRLLPFLLIPLLISAQPLLADSITLKSGETINGTIKNETDTEVTIDVPVSAAITDERVIEKTDIAKEEKAQPDDIAYQQLSQTQPNPEFSFSSQQYDQILSQLNAFLTSYPSSSHVPDVKKLIDVFNSEKDRVDTGEIKYVGRWLKAQEAQSRGLQIQGMQLYATMQQQAASGDFIGAMQSYAALEKDYATTRSYPPAVALAQQVVARVKQVLAQDLINYNNQQAQLKQTIAFTAEPAKTNLIQQAKAEQDRTAAVVAAAIHSGAKWVPLIPDSLVSIQTLQSVATSEGSRLASIQTGPMIASISKVDAARDAMDAHDLHKADDLLTQAIALWSQNEDARYCLAQLKDMLPKSPTPKPAVAATPKPTPRPTPVAVSEVNAPAPDPAKPFYMTLPGAMAIAAVVLIVGGVITVVGQKKKGQQDDAE